MLSESSTTLMSLSLAIGAGVLLAALGTLLANSPLNS